MKEFVGLRAKAYAYLMGDDSEKKATGTKKCVIKRNLSLIIIKIISLIMKSH